MHRYLLILTVTLPAVFFVTLGDTAHAQSCSGGGATSCIGIDGSFNVTVNGVTGASTVWFPTWSSVNGQDDIRWYAGSDLGGGRYRVTPNRSTHPGPGGYVTTHVYLDTDGNAGNGAGNFCYGADIPICNSSANSSFSQYSIYPGQRFPDVTISTQNLKSIGQNSNYGGTGAPSNDYCGNTGMFNMMVSTNGGQNGTYVWDGTATSAQVGCWRDYVIYGYNVDGQAVTAPTRRLDVVAPPPPTVDIWTSPTSVNYGANNTYGWSTSNATYCRFYINGGLVGDTNSGWPINNGGGADGPHYADKTYRIECTNDSGQWSTDQAVLDISPIITVDSVSSGPVGSCGLVSGWTFDPSRPSQSISMHQYIVSPYVAGWDTGATATARPDVNTAYGITGNHGFTYQIPGLAQGSYTARSHGIGIDSAGTQNGVNPYVDRAFTCTAPPTNNSSCVSVTGVPASIAAGGTFTPTVTFNNNGTKQWNSDATPHSIGFASPYDALTWGRNRVPVPAAINPGSNASFTFTATAPTTPGNYDFSWQMVEDGIEWFGPTCSSAAVTVVDQPPVLNSLTISSPFVVANNTNQYTITLSASDVEGASTIHGYYALINFQGTNGGAYRGYLTWYPTNAWPTYKDSQACAGGGYAAIQPGYGDTYLRMDSCSMSASGNTRVVNFVVRFDPTFTSPTTLNDISAYVFDHRSNVANGGWTNFDINFSLGQALTVVKAGTGAGTVTGTGISCGADCTETYTYGTNVTLSAAPAAGSTFTGWSGGGCTGTGTCVVPMTAAQSVTATFADAPPTMGTVTISSLNVLPNGTTQYTINVSASDTGGAANVTGLYALINYQGGNAGSYRGYLTWAAGDAWVGYQDRRQCGVGYAALQGGYGNTYLTLDSCSETNVGNTRTISFVVRFNSSFTSPATGNDISAYIYDNRSQAVGWINFDLNFNIALPLTISKPGTGAGTVSGTGISCGADCSELYTYGTNVTLTAAPAVGSSFTGWSGGGCSGTGSCVVVMTSAQTVTATFTSLPDIYTNNTGPAEASIFRNNGSITFTGTVTNTPGSAISEGGWADVEIDWNSDGSFDNLNAFSGVQLGAFASGQTKNLTYTFNNPPVGTHRYRFNSDTTNVLSEGNESNNRSAWVNFKVVSGSVTADPATVTYGASSTISWSSQGTSGLGCTVSGGSDSWNIDAVASPQMTSVINASTTYTLGCGSVSVNSVTVGVNLTPSLQPNDMRNRQVPAGSVVTMRYNTNGQTCTITGLPGTYVGNGTVDVTVRGRTTYMIVCPSGSSKYEIEITPQIFEE